jgi:hypothetical protein
VNKTNIPLTQDEMDLIQKGLKYNLRYKPKNWIQRLGIEAETAISLLPTPDHDYISHQTAVNIRILKYQQHRNCGPNNPQAFQEMKTLKILKTKLNSNNAILIKADEGNAITVIYKIDYNAKVLDYLQSNGFQTATTDPAK